MRIVPVWSLREVPPVADELPQTVVKELRKEGQDVQQKIAMRERDERRRDQ